jgi:hypothetical protein
MLKNKDGSYNKFPLVIISLIMLISICVIGMFIIDNLPKSILGVQNNSPDSQLHNVEETIYFNNSGYHENYTSWVTPNTTAYNYSVADIGSGGGAGGGGYGIYSTNATFIYFVGGGGGGGNIISNYSAAEITNVSDSRLSEVNSTLQNISSIVLNPLGFDTVSGSVIIFLILMFPIMLIIFKSRQALVGMLILILFTYSIVGFTYSNVLLVIFIIVIIYIIMTDIFNK